jgi:hypothetical protein
VIGPTPGTPSDLIAAARKPAEEEALIMPASKDTTEADPWLRWGAALGNAAPGNDPDRDGEVARW